MASGGLGGAGWRRPMLRLSLAAAKGAAAVAHGVAHLLLLVADARKPPGDRAAQGIRRKHGAHGATAATGEIEKWL